MASAFFTIKEHVLPTQYIREYPGATLYDQEEILKLHIKQYTPKDQKVKQAGAVTIIGAHANGFPKELYEPLWDDLYQSLRKRGQDIQNIWIADVTHQGVSGILNEDVIGNDPSWDDHPRDLLYMINHFRKEMPQPLVGIGHSMGGLHLANLSLMHPRLLSTLILIDPVIVGEAPAATSATIDPLVENARHGVARSSTFRRDLWPSRAEAAASFKRSEFYQSWDSRVFDRWIQYGLRDLPTAATSERNTDSKNTGNPPVTLSTSRHQEVFSFLRPKFSNSINPITGKNSVDRVLTPDLDPAAEKLYPFYRPEGPKTLARLPYVRPSVLYIFGDKSAISPPTAREEKMQRTGVGVGGSGGVREGRVKEFLLKDGGHLMPMENVQEVAEETGKWLVRELERWRKGEQEWKRRWEAKSRKEKTMITEEWERNIGGNPRRDMGKL